MIILEQINRGHYQFLYEILQEREPNASISHESMPTYEDHVIFWSRNPYEISVIIVHVTETVPFIETMVGYMYLTGRKEIGIFIKKDQQNKGYGDEAITAFLETNEHIDILANIAPTNDISKNFFKKHGFKELQHTYRKKGKKIDVGPPIE